MKKSMFNVERKHNNIIFIFNTLTRATVKLPYEKYEDSLSNLTNEEQNTLEESGFIVENDVNEFLLYNFWFHKKTTQQDFLSITYIPTYNCNYKCFYCYEGNREITGVKDTTIDDLKKELISLIQGCRYKYIDFTFFGGEPTLKINEVIQVSCFLKELERYSKKKIDISIVSNGYLLNKYNFNKLYDSGIKNFQISVDGIEEMHNSRRPHKIFNNSYSVIIQNIKNIIELEKIDVKIVLNFNFDDSNAESIFQFVKSPPFDLTKIFIKFNPIKINNSNAFKMDHIDDIKLSKIVNKLKKEALEYGAISDIDNFEEYGPCLNKMNSSIILDNFGNIQKCIFGIGEVGNIIGNIFNNKIKEYVNINNSFKIHYNDSCKICSMLPLCMGGCVRVSKSDSTFKCRKNELFYSIVEPILHQLEMSEKNGENHKNGTFK